MQPRVRHRFVAEIRLDGGERIVTPVLDVDWQPAIECAHFQRVRRGLAGIGSVPSAMRIQPRWQSPPGRPLVAALEVSASDLTQPERIALQYLAEPVRRAVGDLVDAGRIDEGAKYTWCVSAYDTDMGDVERPAQDAFAVEEDCSVQDQSATRRLDDLLSRATHHGPDCADDVSGGDGAEVSADIPVFFDQSVLAEAQTAAAAAGELEAGGVLLGRLSRDCDDGDLILEVTAQVPAREAVAEADSLRFTPATWQAVQAAIRLRRASEGIVGWWHSHPLKVWRCHACPKARRVDCPSNVAFFSSMDVQVHRTAFQGPINVALLLSFQADPQPRVDLFGWRHGLVSQRGYHVLDPVVETI